MTNEGQPLHFDYLKPLADQTGEDPDVLSEIDALLTSAEVLSQEMFEMPEAITPMAYPTFDHILAQRERIRRLQLVPVKDDEQYRIYHSQSYEDLVSTVMARFGDQDIYIATNDFPYFLPDDVEQNIIWLRNPETPRQVLTRFIEKVLKERSIPTEKVILFERPTNTVSKLVRGTLPHVRHIHLWHPKIMEQ